MALIDIRPDDRVCFFGTTGSGKTTMEKRLLRLTRRWVFLDPKYGFTFPGAVITEKFDPSLARQIIQLPEGQTEDIDAWDDVVLDAYHEGDIVIVCDELTAMTRPTRLPPGLGAAIRRGRQRNAAVWCASQRPKDIPSAVFTEAQHFFFFRLSHEDDRKKCVRFTSEAIEPHIRPYDPESAPDGLGAHDCVYFKVGGEWLILRA